MKSYLTRQIGRRALLSTAIAAPAVISFSRGAAAQQVTLSLGHGAAPSNPRHIAAEKFAEVVRTKTGGRISVRVAPSAQLGDDAAMLTGLRTGTLDVSINSQGAASAVLPELAALGLPFLFADTSAAYRVVDGAIGDELAKRFDTVGLVSLGMWDNGIRHTSNSKRAINRPEDLKGLKLRTPPDPMTIDIFQALGAATQQIAFAELYVALQQGVVDGQENPLANIHSSKLYEVNKFISLTGHKWECNPVLVSKMAWGRLSAADQTVLRDAAKEAGALQRGLMQDIDVRLLAEFRANSAVSVNAVDQSLFRAGTSEVAAKWEARPFGDFVKRLRVAAA
jgi:tripartite ATP-independent transporter DctP family solute receptor